jgi:NAD(P)-dependent dehydrogenase (short-subunit alcohol dehydrogenase family)
MIDTPIFAIFAEIAPERQEQIKQLLPMRRAGTSEEVAEIVLFLASDAASCVSGMEIKVRIYL